MLTLFVNDLEFYAYHGVPPEERTLGHRYVMNLKMEVNSNAEFSDNVHETVDYGEATRIAHNTATHNQCFTVERQAQLVGEALLSRFVRLACVTVRLAKYQPPTPFIIQQAGVELRIERPEPESEPESEPEPEPEA